MLIWKWLFWSLTKSETGFESIYFNRCLCLRARFYPWELEFTWLRPASVWVQNRRHALLTLWATAENYRRSDSYFVLNFLSHGPCGQLNPGFSGNSHLLSVMGISIHLMGNSKGIFFFTVIKLQGNTSSSFILVPRIKTASECSLGIMS